ncbi:MAG: hypothetical protein EAZ98_03160 [Oscillatoriales cyanobacterium]|nr:MAG: hypothetical protein EAZ98_03160 [Oscillatoriales cyanobacterium]TAE03699.1 MAG: hypothetical protein EAZ96_11970 [Oscillatoriales cyanobacterium]
MNNIYQNFRYLVAGLILLSASSCSGSDAANSAENQDLTATTQPQFGHIQLTPNQINPKFSQVSQQFSPVEPVLATGTTELDSTVTVTVYKVDKNCKSLHPETVTGPDNQLMSSAVNEVLKQQVFTSLGLVGYRLRIDRTLGIATVDLRTSGNDRQKLQNLSSCQMLSLFGGVRQTLTSYAPWQIKTVRFTELGEDILNTVRE